MRSGAVRPSFWGAVAMGTVGALIGALVVVGVSPASAAPQQHEVTFGYTGSTASWMVPAGVTTIEVVLRGGQGGNGGDDAAGAPPIGSYRGVVAGSLSVTPGQSLTVAVGQGGTTGLSRSVGTEPAQAGGNNPLSGYNGGAGGPVGTVGSSGQGGGGGAASVLRVAGVDIVAGGGGGNGGSGQYAPTRGRSADSTFVARTDTTSTDGQPGLRPSGGNNDGGGSGGGGGGAQGGAQGRVEFGAGTSTEWFGYGGSVGANSTATFPELSASYEHVAQNQQPGSIVIRWVTGTAAAPAAPQGIAGVGEVELYWTSPTQIGQGPVEDYAVQYSSDGGATWSATSLVGSDTTEFTVDGLMNGTAYVFRVAAVTPAGMGDFSARSEPLTPYALPSQPVITDVAPRDGALSVTFDPPVTGAPPTGYQYRVDGGSWVPVSGVAQPIVIAGLANGVEVDIEMRAMSAVGAGAASAPAAGTPQAVPGAPTIIGTSVGIANAAIGFAPGYDGGSAITGYEYRVDGGSWQSLPSTATQIDLSALAPATSYVVVVRALNAVGPGMPSATTTVTTPGPPGLLVGVAATAADHALSVGFALGANGGSPITAVEYSLDGGTSWVSTGTAGPVTIPGLANGIAQSVQLRAVNAVGAGLATTVTATPATVPGAPGIVTVTDTGLGALSVGFTAPVDDGGASITEYQYTTDGGATWRSAGSPASPASVSQGSDGGVLDPEVIYAVALRAVNSMGAGPASNAMNTAGPVPAVPASAPTITAVTSRPGALAVSFVPGDNGGAPVTEYQYSVDGGSWASTGSLGAEFLIGGLNDGTSYSIRVRAVTGVGDGASSAPTSGTPASPPAAPVLNSVQRGMGQLTVGLTLGTDGGSPVSDLEYTLDGGATWVAVGQTTGPVVITGLSNGQGYTVQLRAVNAAGAGGGSNQLTSIPAAVPPQPALTLTPGDTIVAIASTFASDGGAPLIRVEYSTDGGATWNDTGSLTGSALLSGRPNGVPVQVQLRGVNAIGAGAAAVATATPRTVPGAPTEVATVGNTGSVEASWQAPASDGGSPIVSYAATAYATPSSTTPIASCTSTGAEACTIPGLTNGTTYFVAVSATNAAGTGPESQRRPSAMPLVRPAAPNLTSVTAGDERLTLAFTAGSAGDRPIQRYEYSIDGGASWSSLGAGSPSNIQGLTNGTLYTVQIRAVSEAGPGAPSNLRSGTPYGYPMIPTNIVATPGSGSAVVTWDPANLNGNTLLRYAVTAFSAASGGSVVGTTCYTTTTSCTLTGLGNGTTRWISIQTEATQGAQTLYSERSDPRLAVTPNPAGTAPTFGTPTRTADGYTVQITNYQFGSSYSATAPAGTTATVGTSGLLTVTGVAPGATVPVTVMVTRSGYLPASATVSSAALEAGTAPIFDAVVRTADGFTVVITNFGPGAVYNFSTTPTGVPATVNGLGVVTISGLAPGGSAQLSVLVTKPGFTDAAASVTGTALNAALTPVLGTPTRTADGFTVQITNHDDDFAWSASTSAGSASVSATGLVTVTGLVFGESATVTLGTSRTGFAPGSAGATGTALEAGTAPVFDAVVRTADGFTVAIANFDAGANYAFTTPAGVTAAVDALGVVTVSGVAPGASALLGALVTKSGFTDASASVSGSALNAALVPVFGSPTRTADGYTVQLTNYDDDFSWWATTSTGAVSISSSGLVTVTGVSAGASALVTVGTARTGYLSGAAVTSGLALETGIAPVLGAVTSAVDGFTVAIANFDPDASYSFTTPVGVIATVDSTGVVTVSGVAPGASALIDVLVTKTGLTDAAASVNGAALQAALTPEFDAPTRTADGFTVQLSNYDSDFTWSVSASAGSVSVSSSGLVTVTGLAPGESAIVTVGTMRAGYVSGTADASGVALEAGSAPLFGPVTRTATGFTVQITNFNAMASYSFDAPPGVTVALVASRLIVTGLSPDQSALIRVRVQLAGAAEAVAGTVGAAQQTGAAPLLSAPQRTGDVIELRILNFDPALDYVVTATAGRVERIGDRIVISGLAPGQQLSVSVTASNADTVASSSEVTGLAALSAAELASTGAPEHAPAAGLLAAFLLLSGAALMLGRRRTAK